MTSSELYVPANESGVVLALAVIIGATSVLQTWSKLIGMSSAASEASDASNASRRMSSCPSVHRRNFPAPSPTRMVPMAMFPISYFLRGAFLLLVLGLN